MSLEKDCFDHLIFKHFYIKQITAKIQFIPAEQMFLYYLINV